MEINIEIIPKYVKPEIQLLNMLIDDILKNKKLIYTLSEIPVPSLKGSKLLFLERFIKKGIHYSFKENNGVIIPISHYNISKNNISFFLSDTFKKAILEENVFSVLKLKYILKFEENFTKYFYYNFVIEIEDEKSIIITLKELREILNLKEYERFYDFEINILKKLKKDLDLKTNYILKYKKIKSGEFKNNKVTAIEFSIYNKISKIKNEQVNELMTLIVPRIKNFKYTYNILYKALEYISLEELKKSLKLILKNTPNTFVIDEEINKFITNKFRLNKYEKIYEFHEIFKNPIKLQSFIYKELSGTIELKFLRDNLASTEFLKKIYFAKEGEQLFFETKNTIISIRYFKKKESSIEVFQKKE